MCRKVKIAVIDSGLNSYFNKRMGSKIIGGHSYITSECGFEVENNYIDETNHGTSCVSLINKNSVNTQFYIIKVLNKAGKGYGKVLVEALKYLKNADIDLINMSISTESREYADEIEAICNKLSSEGKILIASKSNYARRDSIPASFSNVIGVEGKCFNNQDAYLFDENRIIQCISDNTPVLTEIGENDYTFFKGNSKATALITSIIANIVMHNNKKIDYYEICKILKKGAKRELCDSVTNNTISNLYKINNIDKLNANANTNKILEELLGDFFHIKDTQKLYDCMFDKEVGLNGDNCINLLKALATKLSISVNYDKISIFDFYNIHTINFAIHNKWVNN